MRTPLEAYLTATLTGGHAETGVRATSRCLITTIGSEAILSTTVASSATQAKFEIRGCEENECSLEFCINMSLQIMLMVSRLKLRVASEQAKKKARNNQVFFKFGLKEIICSCLLFLLRKPLELNLPHPRDRIKLVRLRWAAYAIA